jgi:hypothetical protein
MRVRFLRRAVVNLPRVGQVLVGPEVGRGTSDGLGWHNDVIDWSRRHLSKSHGGSKSKMPARAPTLRLQTGMGLPG